MKYILVKVTLENWIRRSYEIFKIPRKRKKKQNEMVKNVENEQGRKCLVFATRRRLMLMKKKEKKRKISMCKNMT